MKRILFVLALICIIPGCKNKTSFKVEGVLKGRTEKSIYINRLEVNTPVFVDSAKIKENGEFRFKVKASQPEFYQIGFTTADFITILAEPGEKIRLKFEGKTLYEKYTVTGSEGSAKIQKLDQVLNDTKRKLDSLSSLYSKASAEPGFDVKGPMLEADYSRLVKDQRMKNIEFILKNTTSMASIKALYQRLNPETYVLYEPRDLQYLKIVTDSLTPRYPKSKNVQALSADFKKEMNQMYMNQIGKAAQSLPELELNPDLKDVNGIRTSLSSLKGKYVLVTFWSFNSKNCVAENLQLKEFYKSYHNKGFEIYQINLDQNEANWKSAVKFDELPWISTREDDPLNPKYAKLFNVQTVPANFLFDKNGQLIASDLHGRYLQIKLDQLFNK
ncbi:MAG TPA: TlpA disulfide reductase family protein [Bacteroidales bacterium]|nr:TlpA disulfide reductase family protein [Bacteroidales bacterium]HPT21724.1 TlpA disulfide reductase family protein [Bacteroidales bacterium]